MFTDNYDSQKSLLVFDEDEATAKKPSQVSKQSIMSHHYGLGNLSLDAVRSVSQTTTHNRFQQHLLAKQKQIEAQTLSNRVSYLERDNLRLRKQI